MLTKSKFRRFLDCPNEYWLDHHFPEPPGEETLEYQLRREMGYRIEALARALPRFAENEARRIEFGRDFVTDRLFARADIVVTDNASGEIEIFEVKSGTSAKPDYQIDLAFQCHVARESGLHVKGAFLITVDSTYLFDGNLETEKLLRITDETAAVNELLQTMPEQIALAISCLDGPEPEIALTDYCKANKLNCRSIRRRFPAIPEFNVSNIFNAGSKKLDALLAAGILDIREIPQDFMLTSRESALVAVERSGEPYIDKDTILGELNGLVYPLNFLDYESFNPAVPEFARTRPYQQMVFQYSLHTIDRPGAEMRHSFHLSRNDGRHPTEEIVERLHADLNGRIGTVFIWSEGFEKKRNTEIAEMFPPYADFLTRINDAVYDLRKIFSRRLYIHPGFRGRDSIKRVLPVLCPGLSYDEMNISDGLTASIKWYHMATGRGTAEEREKTFRDLADYCRLDTLAMVEIYKHLQTL
jgi:hypothetical protein